MPQAPSDLGRYRRNLQGEVDSAALYKALADSEPDEKLKQVYRKLAAVEESHAEFWGKRIQALGGSTQMTPGLRSRFLAWLARRMGAETVLPIINTLERGDMTQYDKQPEAVEAGLPADECSHARVVREMERRVPGGLSGSELAQLEGRHKGGGGNALRAAVLGANDGLVSNLSLVTGVAGANLASHDVLVTGMAGLIAGACSMAMGEWLSVNSARELAQAQIAIEAEELREMPQEEKAELSLIYQAKGLSEKQADQLAEKIISNPDTALDTLAREELGIDPDELGGSAWVAGGTSFLLFSAGAVVPLLPFVALQGNAAVAVGAGLSGVAMFLIGVAIGG